MSAKPPESHNPQPPSWAPTTSPAILSTTTDATSSLTLHQSPPSRSPIDFSPPLIAMVVVAAAAFLLVTFSHHLLPPFHRLSRLYKRWRRRRRLRPHFPPSDVDSYSPPPPYESSDGFYVYSPYGLDESVIKKIPLTIYKPPKSSKSSLKSSKLGFIDQLEEFHDCAVCLLEFEDGDYVRTLPLCYHSFHVDCIDIWLKSHATCPLCRAGVFFPPLPESPLTPLMAARIRPSLDLESTFLEPLPEIQQASTDDLFSPGVCRSNRRELDFLLKRSHSFSFERSFPSEGLALGAATTPHHHDHNRRRSFWMKRPSSTPFSSAAKSRVFSFRIKSPSFFRRRGFCPMSESSASWRYGGGSSRRMKAMASPLFGRTGTGVFSSSRMRSGDPEALISPERYGRR